MKSRGVKKFWQIPATVIAAAVILFFISSIYVNSLMKQEKHQINMYMEEVTDKTVLAFDERIQGYIDTLNGIAAAISSEPADREATLAIFQKQLKESLMSRYGIIYSDGTGVGVDRTLGVLDGEFGEKEYFEKCIEGKSYISEPIHDRFSGQQVILFGVPVTNEAGERKAVLCGIQTVERFQSVIEIPVMDGQGYFHVIDSEGNMLLRSQLSDLEQNESNIFRDEYEKAYGLDTMKENMKKGMSGIAGFTQPGGIPKYVMYAPAKINDWYVATIAPVSILTQKEREIQKNSLLLLFSVSAIIILLMSFLMIHRQKTKEAIRRLAYYDPLTGAYNKNMFLKALLEKPDLYEGKYAVAVLDLCNFKVLNKMFGFGQGDKVIQNIHHILGISLKTQEIYAREASDHFWILFEENDEEVLRRRINAIFDKIGTTFLQNNTIQYSLICRCGVYVISGKKVGELQSMFDLAVMARETQLDIHKNSIAFYDKAMSDLADQRAEIEQNMRHALEAEEFEVYLQPKYAVSPAVRLSGAEALTRWKFRDGRMIFPDQFIPLFEKNGFIVELDMYMLEHVCRILRRWLDEGKTCVPVSINQSRVNMYNPNYMEDIMAVVEAYRIPHELLEFEITESAVMDEVAKVRLQFQELKRCGFFTSMDDFGSGYSSLNLLKDLQTDVVKIDKEFFNESFPSLQGRKIVESIIRMLQELGIRVLAEGIETKEQVGFLQKCGCDYIQGYYFGKPIPTEEFERDHLAHL